MSKIRVIFDRDGDKVGDLDSMDYAQSKMNDASNMENTLTVYVANSLVIYCFRVLVREGKINPNDILLYNKATDPFLRYHIRVDKNGEQESYPIGMMDTHSEIIARLI